MLKSYFLLRMKLRSQSNKLRACSPFLVSNWIVSHDIQASGRKCARDNS